MKFKNLRRPTRAEKAGISVSPPVKKKFKVEPQETQDESSSSDLAKYELHVKQIKKMYRSHKWSVSSLAKLLNLTRTQRQQWITQDCPKVAEVLEVFPCLQEHKMVCSIVTCRCMQ